MAHGINANLLSKWQSRTQVCTVLTTLPGGGRFILVPRMFAAVPGFAGF
jgi:hypothetical protein